MASKYLKIRDEEIFLNILLILIILPIVTAKIIQNQKLFSENNKNNISRTTIAARINDNSLRSFIYFLDATYRNLKNSKILRYRNRQQLNIKKPKIPRKTISLIFGFSNI